MKWTAAQQDTIGTREKNILVSAAAGSGKTTVLIERIKQLILEDRVDVDRFLITTFTNAAAAEMKAKLETAIRKETERIEKEDPENGREDLEFLHRQMTLLSQASIGTFHKFAQGMIREFFHLTDLEPGAAIGDEARMALLLKESVDEVFETRFEEDGEEFRRFLRTYSSDRNDEGLKENILKIYKEMRSIPRYMEWAEDTTSKLGGEDPLKALKVEDFIFKKTEQALAEAKEAFAGAAEILNREETGSIYLKARQDAEKVAALAETAASLDMDELGEAVRELKYNSMRTTKAETEAFEQVREQVNALRDQGKDAINGVKKPFFSLPPEEWREILKSLAGDTGYFLSLVRDTETAYRKKKRDLNIIDFDDVMHYCLEILGNDQAAEEYKNRFVYIFIDEYQDSNLLQEEIVDRIARGNNVFMVGDVKQSIYKFRLAEPEIFRDKYRRYRDEGDDRSMKIDLNTNFRSRKRIRDVVNRIFEGVMEGYDEDARLYGNDDPHPTDPVALHIIDPALTRGGEGDEDGAGKEGAEDAALEELEEEKQEELEDLTEAALVAEVIRRQLGTTVHDRDGNPRPLTYGDIAILSRGKNGVHQIERYLNNEGVPAYGETAGDYYETVEIQVFLNLLRVIDNREQDVPLISVMYSMFFDFTAEELARIRIFRREGSFARAVRDYAREGEDPRLREKILDMMDTIDRWREISRTVPLDEFMRMLIYDTGYYEYCSSLPVGRQRVSNLRLLMEKGADYEETGYLGLHGFLAYVEAMKRTDQKVSEASLSGEGEDVVRVMTVHKSKGLEFPLVILTGAGKKISSSVSGYPAIMHKAFAIALPQIDRDHHWERRTLLQQVIRECKKDEDLEEEIRILYVALTRPMEKLEIIGTASGWTGDMETQGKRSFLEMIYPVLREMEEEDPDAARVEVHEGRFRPDGEHEEEEPGWWREHGEEDHSSEDLSEIIDRRLSFVYPHGNGGRIKPKYSVSELNHMEMEAEEQKGKGPRARKASRPAVRIPDLVMFGEKETEFTAAQIGTIMHAVMEQIDFPKAAEEGLPYLKEAVEDLLQKGILTPEEEQEVVLEDILAFFDLPQGQRAARSSRLCREKEFILKKEIEGEPVVVQGVIDCWFEEEDGLVLIDYKNSYIQGEDDEEIIADRYREQIRLYREALELAEERPVKESWLYLFQKRAFLPMD